MRRLDIAIAAVVFIVGQAHIWLLHGLGRSPTAAAAVAIGGLALVWRRRAPLLVGVVELIALFAMAAATVARDVEPLSVGMIAAIWVAWFTLGASPNLRSSLVGLGLGVVASLGMVEKPDVNLYLAIVLTTFVVPWLIGAALRVRSEFREASLTSTTVPQLDPAAIAALTRRESEVLALMVEGLSNQEIAERLHVSLATVKSHVVAILRKLGVRDRTQAVVAALSSEQDG